MHLMRPLQEKSQIHMHNFFSVFVKSFVVQSGLTDSSMHCPNRPAPKIDDKEKIVATFKDQMSNVTLVKHVGISSGRDANFLQHQLVIGIKNDGSDDNTVSGSQQQNNACCSVACCSQPATTWGVNLPSFQVLGTSS